MIYGGVDRKQFIYETVGCGVAFFDYDNDGWLDIFATSYDRTLKDVVKGLNGEPHTSSQNKQSWGCHLFHLIRHAGRDSCDTSRTA